MKHSKSVAYIIAILFCATAAALAPIGGGDFDLSWHTIDGGGGTSTGAGFELSGTMGYPEPSQCQPSSRLLTRSFLLSSSGLHRVVSDSGD